MSKREYRDLFIKMKPYIKFNKFLSEVHINSSNFSHFLNYEYDWFLSVEKLDQLYKVIMDKLNNFA